MTESPAPQPLPVEGQRPHAFEPAGFVPCHVCGEFENHLYHETAVEQYDDEPCEDCDHLDSEHHLSITLVCGLEGCTCGSDDETAPPTPSVESEGEAK